MTKDTSENKLFEAIANLKTKEEAAAFFDDLCTIKELQDMVQRYEVALMLYGGKNYGEISAATGASSATISRVNRCLNYGKNGYRTAIERAGGKCDE